MFSPDLEVEAVEGLLAERLGEVSGLQPLGGGEWSRAFAFRSRGRDLVIRFGRYPEDYAKDRQAERFAGPDLPIPAVHEIGEGLGLCYAISTRGFGEPFDRLDEAGYRRVLPAVFRALDAMRLADLSGTHGYGMWTPDGSAPHGTWRGYLLDVESDRSSDRTHGWRRQLERLPAAVETFREGVRLLRGLADAAPEARHLIHADLIADNVRVRGDRVTAVVDWANSMYGDFLYDLGRLTFWVPWFPELRSVDLIGLARAHYEAIGLDVPDFEARLRCCQLHIGLDAQAYNAFTERWEELRRSGRRTLALARGEAS